MYFILIRLGIPQSALAFIFIGRGSRTPLQVGLYKNFQNKMKPTQITTGQTGLTGRPLNCQNWLSTHTFEIVPVAFSLNLVETSLHIVPAAPIQIFSICTLYVRYGWSYAISY